MAGPSNLGMAGLQFARQAPGGFGHHLKVADYRILDHVSGIERRSTATDIFLDSGDAFQDVQEVLAVVLHRGTASLRTDSRISG